MHSFLAKLSPRSFGSSGKAHFWDFRMWSSIDESRWVIQCRPKEGLSGRKERGIRSQNSSRPSGELRKLVRKTSRHSDDVITERGSSPKKP